MATHVRLGAGAISIAGAVAAVAGPAFAISSVQEDVNVGTSFTRQPHEVVCNDSGGCSITWTHNLVSECGRVADARLRFQRDLLPDLTQEADYGFSTCTAKSWQHGSEFLHGHHQDGRVDSGYAVMHFGAK